MGAWPRELTRVLVPDIRFLNPRRFLARSCQFSASDVVVDIGGGDGRSEAEFGTLVTAFLNMDSEAPEFRGVLRWATSSPGSANMSGVLGCGA